MKGFCKAAGNSSSCKDERKQFMTREEPFVLRLNPNTRVHLEIRKSQTYHVRDLKTGSLLAREETIFLQGNTERPY